jgi:hypothetical protein
LDELLGVRSLLHIKLIVKAVGNDDDNDDDDDTKGAVLAR